MFAGWRIFYSIQFIVKPIPENPKMIYLICFMTISYNDIILKMVFGDIVGFGYLGLHSECFPHTRNPLKDIFCHFL